MTFALRGVRGVPSKADIVSNLSKGGCVNLRTGGVQKFEIFADVINRSLLRLISSSTYPNGRPQENKSGEVRSLTEIISPNMNKFQKFQYIKVFIIYLLLQAL